MRRSYFLASLVTVFAPIAALAHPGHSPFDHGVSHAFTNSNHVLQILVAAVCVTVVGASARVLIQRGWRPRAVYSAGLLIAGAGVLAIGLAM